MPEDGPTHFPAEALEWLVGDRFDPRVLTLTASTGLADTITKLTSHVSVIDKDFDHVKAIAEHAGVLSAVARAEALPFESCTFDVVFAHQVLQLLAPGLALPEMARVLRPGGWVAASVMVRDDSVPWVRRLIELMRSVDPGAMSGEFGQRAVEELLASKYFPSREQRDFRVWIPVNRTGLVTMAADQPAIVRLPEIGRNQLLERVEALFDEACTGTELRLPYQLRCYRAFVDHAELTTPIKLREDALIIPL